MCPLRGQSLESRLAAQRGVLPTVRPRAGRPMKLGMILEVDGSLRNPFVVATVVLWSALLASFAFFAATRWKQPQRGRSERLQPILILLMMIAGTPDVQFNLGNLLYKTEAMLTPGPSITSVGFWGGPPALPAWAAASLAFVVALRRKGRTQ